MSVGRFAFAAMPTLRTERLVLREVSAEDTRAIFELFADPEVAKFTDTGPFSAEEEATEVVDWIARIFDERRGMRWAIAPAGDEGWLIGTCGYNEWRQHNNSAVIGYDLGRRYWGRGLTTEAVGAILGFGFDRMGLNRIEADVTVGNTASRRVLEKLGFTEEGLLRQGGYWRNTYHDLHLYSLLREEFTQRIGQ